jgi:hypothetical protein
MGVYNHHKVPVKPPFKDVNIQLNWSDGYGTCGKMFATVQELANFLKDNPTLGETVGYVSKAKMNII